MQTAIYTMVEDVVATSTLIGQQKADFGLAASVADDGAGLDRERILERRHLAPQRPVEEPACL